MPGSNFVEGIATSVSQTAQPGGIGAHEPFPVRGEQVILDMPRPGDAQEIVSACQDSDIQRFTMVPFSFGLPQAQHFLSVMHQKLWDEGGANWLIRAFLGQGNLRFVGTVALRPTGEKKADVGYWIAPESRGQGLMTRALALAVRTAFDNLGFECVTWQANPENLASHRVAWKVGFTFSGVARGVGVNNRGQREDRLIASFVKGDTLLQPRGSWEDVKILGQHPNPRDSEALVRQFHQVYNLPVVTTGADISGERMHMRLALILEETTELVRALYGKAAAKRLQTATQGLVEFDEHARDTIEVADALADLTYVVYGMALEAGISLPAVLAEVQASNLSKLDENGQPIYREDGKVMKGPGFFPPNIARALTKNLAPTM
ncbi:GNAT family N-acetyltransferase [Mobiluncus mulieris]|uniref:GNAT family N-acetyltransferase n=1 Tax=Mobiluncus mulieris TaxID=2052 RepID=UPI00146FF990|nr:GNAT family N-acetyltransferase [Mobiluncus mulieris]